MSAEDATKKLVWLRHIIADNKDELPLEEPHNFRTFEGRLNDI